ncbi:MAG: hypothetical protein AAB486_04545 [Patescibacteria group bacterium]
MPETLPSPLSTPGLTPPVSAEQPPVVPPEASIPLYVADNQDTGASGGILIPLLVILVLIYFFGPASWRNFLRTAKDNILEEVKITASKLQSKKPEVPPLTLTPAVSPIPKAATPSSSPIITEEATPTAY